MARDVLIRLKKLSANGKAPANAKVRFTPTILRVDAEGYILDDYFDVIMVDGEGTANDLPETDLNWAYKVQIKGHGAGGGLKETYDTWYVHLPAGEGTVNFEDLPRIDPTTLTPVNDPDPAWVDAVTAVFNDSVSTAVEPAMVTAAEDETSEFRTRLNAAIGQAGNVHIIGLWGQSNMSGRGAITNAAITDPTHPRIFQVGAKTRTLRPASEPLDMKDTPTGIGPGLQFARRYLQHLPPNDVVVLTPSAMGSTPLVSTAVNAWQWGGTTGNLTAQAMTQIADAKTFAAEQWPGAKITVDAILWLQGEQDGGTNITGTAYQTELDRLITETRAALGNPDLPFILGPMMGEALAVGTRAEINEVHSETPYRVARTGFSVRPATGPEHQNGDNLHYNAAGQRINGARMFDEYLRVLSGLAPVNPTEPVIPPSALWSDDFNRADGPLTTTATGDKTWEVTQTAGTGSASVASNTLALSNTDTTARTFALVDSDTGNGTYRITVANPGDYTSRIVFRYVDADNYVYLTRWNSSNNTWAMYHRTAGTEAMVTAKTTPIVAGDRVELVLNGTTVALNVNDEQLMSGTVDRHPTGTRYGVATAGSTGYAARWDDVEFWA